MEAQRKPTAEIHCPRGSEWRRWDLHVHTPYSVLNNGFGEDFEAYAKTLLERAIERQIAVIGVTDYFLIRGYRELRELQRDERRLAELLGDQAAAQASRILLLPNVELRLSELIKIGSTEPRVNLHVIFSEHVDPGQIERNFLHQLHFLSEADPNALDERPALTVANLEAFGARLKEQHERFGGQSDLKVGMSQAVVSHEEITKVLRSRSFAKHHLLVLAADEHLSKIDWDGPGHVTRLAPIQKAHMLFSANPNTRLFGLGEKHASTAAFLEEFKSKKPCIHGSDAHEPERLFVFDGDRQLWVRADPTFNGLCQLLHEPEDRVFLGPEPEALARVRAAGNKSIERLSFERRGDPDAKQRWFSGSLPLNPGLVAVIGPKGAGKSALGDAIALAGNAHNDGRFSFLTRERFLSPRDHLAERFEVELGWRAGEPQRRRLDQQPDPLLHARVKHIPQHYLEEICGEIQRSEGATKFDAELEAVILSHVPSADRLGKQTLRELLDHSGAAKEAGIERLHEKLAGLNHRYFQLLAQAAPEARKALLSQLEQRRADLAAHEQAKPSEVPAPDEEAPDSQTTEAGEQLAAVVTEIEELDRRLAELAARQAAVKKREVAIARLISAVENLRSQLQDFKAQIGEDAELLGLDAGELVELRVDDASLSTMQTEIARELEQIEDALDPEHSSSPARARREASERADQLRARLAEPQRRYQEYQRALKQWRRERQAIIGEAGQHESIAGLEAKLAALSRLPEQIEIAREERRQLLAEIFAAKQELLAEYKRLYGPVQEFVEEHPLAQQVPLSLTAENALDGFEDGILAMIHQGRRGSFCGEQEGRERLREIIARHDLSTLAGIEAFLAELEAALRSDLRQAEPQPVEIGEQLVAQATPEALYDFLFGLSYLRPRFELRWQDKPLSQLSPGERGTLLLIFYLLIDREQIPLVIDQPEENLDNETVYHLLVPAIKRAKQRRQIIMITHNPNLAVVCDADQVIHASFDKKAGNRVTYTSGAIENPEINKLIVDVLEGTKPAFDLRDAKYEVLDRANS